MTDDDGFQDISSLNFFTLQALKVVVGTVVFYCFLVFQVMMAICMTL
jgi:hypothetical protein